MLVLSRQRDETIMIGDDIEITVVDIRGDKVRVGITAPARIAVHRKEVYEAIKAENEQASRVKGGEAAALGRGLEEAARARRRDPDAGGAEGGGLSARLVSGGARERERERERNRDGTRKRAV